MAHAALHASMHPLSAQSWRCTGSSAACRRLLPAATGCLQPGLAVCCPTLAPTCLRLACQVQVQVDVVDTLRSALLKPSCKKQFTDAGRTLFVPQMMCAGALGGAGAISTCMAPMMRTTDGPCPPHPACRHPQQEEELLRGVCGLVLLLPSSAPCMDFGVCWEPETRPGASIPRFRLPSSLDSLGPCTCCCLAQGDSGGPLFLPSPNGSPAQDLQYGITSFGVGDCGTTSLPGETWCHDATTTESLQHAGRKCITLLSGCSWHSHATSLALVRNVAGMCCSLLLPASISV